MFKAWNTLCPKCKRYSKTAHCKAQECTWRICAKCSFKLTEFIVFDYSERYFIGRT